MEATSLNEYLIKDGDTGSDDEIFAISDALAKAYEELSFIYKLDSISFSFTEDLERFLCECGRELLSLISADAIAVSCDSYKTSNGSFGLRVIPNVHNSLSGLLDELYDLLNDAQLQFWGKREYPFLILKGKSKGEDNLYGFGGQILSIRLEFDSRYMGTLFVIRFSSDDFTSDQIKLALDFSRRLSWFFANNRLLEDVYDMFVGVMNTFVSIIDAKDEYTRGHSQRVAYISAEIAKRLGRSKEEVHKVYLAGLLHDVGKVGVDEGILRKPGRLSSKEFDTIKKHPLIGARIVQSIRHLKVVVPGILYHHERYDGSGYPEGLKAEKIPLMGSIVGLADWLDAITSDRTYRKGIGFGEAVEKLCTYKEKLFSREIIDIVGNDSDGFSTLWKRLRGGSELPLPSDILSVDDLRWLV